MGVDPLSCWHRDARLEGEAELSDVSVVRDALGRVPRYWALHNGRSNLPPFERDVLRQGDLDALGLGSEPRSIRLEASLQSLAERVLERLWAALPERDEPWLERWMLHLLGYERDRDDLSLWSAVLDRQATGERDTFASERRAYALAALAWRAALHPEGEAEQRLRAAMAHRRSDVRASAAIYLIAAHRLSGKNAPMSTVSMLHRMVQAERATEPRLLARVLLEVERVDFPREYPDGVYYFAASSPSRGRSASTLVLRSAHTAAHVHAMLGGEEPFSLMLAEPVRGARFELASTITGRGKALGELAVGDIGLRAGDRLVYARAEREGSLVLRSVSPIDESGLSLPAPALRKRALLLETQVNGTRFHRAAALLPTLKEGDALQLRREPSNAHDDRAIEVLTRDGEKLGYVPRTRNRVLAALMDAGDPVEAELVSAEENGEWPLVLAAVYAKASV